MKVNCTTCGKEIKMPRCHAERVGYKFCSKKCRQTKFIPETCQECGTTFYRTAQSAGSKFCSSKCVTARNKRLQIHKIHGQVTVNCAYCKKEFRIRKTMARVQKYCSQKCFGLDHQGTRVGEENHKWKPKVKVTCLWCGKNFETFPSRKGRKKYCCKSHAILANINRFVGDHRTDIEKIMAVALSDSEIPFDEQVVMFEKFQVDFLLPNKIVVQCDGIYWHNRPDAIRRDKGQDAYLRKCGYTVLRFTDKQIHKDIQGCISIILESRQVAR